MYKTSMNNSKQDNPAKMPAASAQKSEKLTINSPVEIESDAPEASPQEDVGLAEDGSHQRVSERRFNPSEEYCSPLGEMYFSPF